MHIIIIGGGVIGVSTAWELQSRGHTVELFEARDALALETSHANGGMLTAGMCEPWNAPGVWKDLVRSFIDPKSAMKLHPSAIPGLTLWGLRFLAQSTPKRFKANTEANYQLCAYSVERTTHWVNELGLECAYRTTPKTPAMEKSRPTGNMKIFQTRQAADFSLQLTKLMEPLGLKTEFLDKNAVLDKEPALMPIRDHIECGLYYPADAAGDACAFTQALGEQLEAKGGVLHLQSPVSAIASEKGRVVGVTVDGRTHKGDAVIVCAASSSPSLTTPCGVHLPIKPVKGYSLTIDVGHIPAQKRPNIAVINQAMHAAVNPLGNRLRVAGTAEFTRKTDGSLSKARVENLMNLLNATYPDIASQISPAQASPWCGYRPMSADGKPYIGSSGIDNLFINSGHGYLGWTQAAGSAALLADQVDNIKPALPPELFAVSR